MLVCIDKVTCVRMHKLIGFHWDERIRELEKKAPPDEQDELFRQRQIAWMRETRMAVVMSGEQGEVAKFSKWDLDIIPHRKLMKEGIDLPESMRAKPEYRNLQTMALDDALKVPEHPLRVAIVCAMWLTGFDVPTLSTLYLDKPLKAHTLMQAIARANRVAEGKNNGLIVDCCGILRHLRKALATFAGTRPDGEGSETDPARPEEELLADLAEAIALVRGFLDDREASLDREQADITDIIRQLHQVVDEAIEVRANWQGEELAPYDISKIDFDRLRQEFEHSPRKNTTVQNLREAVEQRLQKLLLQNPLRTDFQQHYEQIVADYNREKDRVTIEGTFEALFTLVQDLDEEEHRAVREGLDEESLAIFDLLKKPELKPADIKRIKSVAVELLERLKSRIREIDHWRDRESPARSPAARSWKPKASLRASSAKPRAIMAI